jgi:hypothetical protein
MHVFPNTGKVLDAQQWQAVQADSADGSGCWLELVEVTWSYVCNPLASYATVKDAEQQ